ncbi:MAG: hypothetical protein IKK03_08870 [Lachnospiraceae bacterium]|nr:hypothetical protein [Lachnospiraceae bacterium]
MKREYIKPEAEMMKFVETEELMTDPGSVGGPPTTHGVWEGTIDSNWN